jgi:hypothetical protein
MADQPTWVCEVCAGTLSGNDGVIVSSQAEITAHEEWRRLDEERHQFDHQSDLIADSAFHAAVSGRLTRGFDLRGLFHERVVRCRFGICRLNLARFRAGSILSRRQGTLGTNRCRSVHSHQRGVRYGRQTVALCQWRVRPCP